MVKNLTITGSLQNILATNPSRFHEYAENAYGGTILADLAKQIAQDENVEVLSVNSHRMTYAIKRLAKRGVIDLKPFFKNSKHARKTKGGGWFLVVPIQQSTRKIVQRLGRKTYDNIRDAFGDSLVQSVSVEGLFDIKNARQNTLQGLDYRPTSTTVSRNSTRQSNGKVTGSYIMFRTVSSKSAPSSWVLNKNNVNEDNTSQRLQNDVQALINKRMSALRKVIK